MAASPRSLVPLLALAALGIVLLATLASRREPAPRDVVPVPSGQPELHEAMGDLADQSIEVRRTTATESSVPATAPESKPATGRLRLHVVDAVSGTPLAGATCVVYAERGGNRVFGTLQTDADGRASIGDLPENTILVRVERAPPHARTFAGVWLREGESRDLDIRVGAGGSVHGRVVDDTGLPLAGVEILPDEFAWRADTRAEARSDAEGRFEVDHLVSSAHGIWIVDGALRPTRWIPVNLAFRSGVAFARVSVQVEDGKRVDVGDVVLERPTLLAGRLLDARRAAVDGAWVQVGDSRDSLRRVAIRSRTNPSQEAATKATARTRSDGSFRLDSTAGSMHLTVATPDGITQTFVLPDLAPGERRDDLEFVLDDVTVLEIELVDPHGERVTRRLRSPAMQDVHAQTGGVGIDHLLLVRMYWADDTSVETRVVSDEDGVFRLQFSASNVPAHRLHVEMPGYVPVDVELGATLGRFEHRTIAVRPTPCVRTNLRVRAPKSPDGATAQASLLVEACLIPPDAFVEAFRESRYVCCGLGSQLVVPLAELERDLDLPVRSESERFWIHVLVSRQGWQTLEKRWNVQIFHELHLGPFAPGDMVHAIEIPELDIPVAETTLAANKEAGEPPPISAPSNERVKLPFEELAKPVKTRLCLLESDGRPLGRRCRIAVLFTLESGTDVMQSWTDGSGCAGFTAGLGGPGTLFVSYRRKDLAGIEVPAAQILSISALETTQALPIRLAAWRTVEFVVRGAVCNLPEADLRARLSVLNRPGSEPDDWRRIWPVALPVGPDHIRRFRACLTPGAFELAFPSQLFDIPPTRIEVRNQDELQVFELSSTRK